MKPQDACQRKWVTLVNRWLKSVLVNSCLACERPVASDLLCKHCIELLPWLELQCKRCAEPLIISETFCPSCLLKPPPFTVIRCPLRYEWPVDVMMARFKNNKELIYGTFLQRLLCNHLCQQHDYVKPEVILPVPISRQGMQERGFNQAVFIARRLSLALDIPVDITSLRKVRETKPQKELTKKARARNLRHAFHLENPIDAKHIALVDDVVTTGTTVSEITQLLLGNGCERVDIWCLARTQTS